MDSAPPIDDPPTEADRRVAEPVRPWSLIYVAILAHLALWIVLLALFSRFFGSAA